MLRVLVLASALISIPVMAQTPPSQPRATRPGPQRPRGGGGNPVCVPLKEACVRAGYSMAAPFTSEKSVVAGCMAKFARGETVKGIALKPTDKSIEPCIKFMKVKMAQATNHLRPAPGAPRNGHKATPARPTKATPPKATVKPAGK